MEPKFQKAIGPKFQKAKEAAELLAKYSTWRDDSILFGGLEEIAAKNPQNFNGRGRKRTPVTDPEVLTQIAEAVIIIKEFRAQ